MYVKSSRLVFARSAFSGFLVLSLSACVYRPWTELSSFSYAMPKGSKYASDYKEPSTQVASMSDAKAMRGRLFMPGGSKESGLPKPEIVARAEVRQELSAWTGKNRKFVERSFERAEPYLPLIHQVFGEEGVPKELMAVALVESGFQPEAKSPAGALGMWQFMRRTGESYGLRSSWIRDDRKDVLKSTVAAAQHLKDLYKIYGCWELSLAAYNAGSGRVDRAIRNAGVRDFWTISKNRHLPQETRLYVPKIYAAAMIMKAPHEHGFSYEALIDG